MRKISKELKKKRKIPPKDIIERLTCKVMKDGKKILAKRIVNNASLIVENNLKLSFLTVLEKALENVKPEWGTKPRRLGGVKQNIPTKISNVVATTLAIRWIVNGARDEKKPIKMYEKLAFEIINAYNKSGSAFTKKENLQKQAFGNMAFSGIKV